eukprot:80263-Pyramimonas_sp.AAC.1
MAMARGGPPKLPVARAISMSPSLSPNRSAPMPPSLWQVFRARADRIGWAPPDDEVDDQEEPSSAATTRWAAPSGRRQSSGAGQSLQAALRPAHQTPPALKSGNQRSARKGAPPPLRGQQIDGHAVAGE